MAYGGDVTNPEIKKKLIAQGWLACDGSKKNSSGEYRNLYEVIGDAFGVDGNNFYLPDMQGRFLRGVDHGKGRDPDVNERKHPISGEKVRGGVGSVQEDESKSHTHAAELWGAIKESFEAALTQDDNGWRQKKKAVKKPVPRTFMSISLSKQNT